MLALVIVATIAAGPSAEWAAEPSDYRGVSWGTMLGDARQRIPIASCRCVYRPDYSDVRECKVTPVEPSQAPLLRMCRSSLTIARLPVNDLLLFERDAFAGASMEFSSEDFEALRDVFVEKYGPPTAATEKEISTRMGAKATNHVLSWRGPRVTITLTRFKDTLRSGGATIAVNEYTARREAEQAATKKKGAGDF